MEYTVVIGAVLVMVVVLGGLTSTDVVPVSGVVEDEIILWE